MRIGLDWRAQTAAPLSGIARQVQAMAGSLAARANTELLRYTAAPLDHPHRQQAHCPPWPTPVNGLHRLGNRWAFEARFLPQAIVRDRLDVYIATINMGLPVSLRRGDWQPGRGGARLVLLLHDLFQITHRNRHASMLRRMVYGLSDHLSIAYALRCADAIWTPSARTADATALLFPGTRSRLRVLPNAVPFQTWQAAPGTGPMDDAALLPPGVPQDTTQQAPRYWLLVGAREPRKNLPWFLAGWQRAREQADIPELLIVAGPEDLPHPPAGVHLVNGLSDAALAAVYRQARRLWHPAYAEGFGLPVVEACAAGTPVATAQGSALDEVSPPLAPRFDAFDTDDLVRLMCRLAAQDLPTQARAPGESIAELQEWAQRFDLPAYARRLDALLQELS